TTRLYLSGAEAGLVAGLFSGSFVDARVLPGEVGTASAVKMAYAAWTKGTAALLLAIGELARAEGVEGALHEEWRVSLPGLPERGGGRPGGKGGWGGGTGGGGPAAPFARGGRGDGGGGGRWRRSPRLSMGGGPRPAPPVLPPRFPERRPFPEGDEHPPLGADP